MKASDSGNEWPGRILTVKEMDPDDQPRERALRHGCSVLSTPDLWALILRTGTQGKPVTELCRDIMRSAQGSLLSLERKHRAELMATKGVGTTKALQIEAVMELVRRYLTERVGQKVRISGPSDIFDVMRPLIGNLPHEEIWALFLNRQNVVVGELMITRGSAVASVFDLKKIIREALLREAEGLALAHNHPSGNLCPSMQDDEITRKLSTACRSMDLRFLDHLIVTAGGYYSYRDAGKL